MATNVQGIAIVIKAFLPTGKTINEQYAALNIVKTAHETGDYAPVLQAAQIDEVKSEQKTRRTETPPTMPLLGGAGNNEPDAPEPQADPEPDAAPPWTADAPETAPEPAKPKTAAKKPA